MHIIYTRYHILYAHMQRHHSCQLLSLIIAVIGCCTCSESLCLLVVLFRSGWGCCRGFLDLLFVELFPFHFLQHIFSKKRHSCPYQQVGGEASLHCVFVCMCLLHVHSLSLDNSNSSWSSRDSCNRVVQIQTSEQILVCAKFFETNAIDHLFSLLHEQNYNGEFRNLHVL